MQQDPYPVLVQLNYEYVRAVEARDGAWFEKHLAEDFTNTDPGGEFSDRQGFIQRLSRVTGVAARHPEDVVVRLFDDFAIIHARSVFKTAGGAEGAVRYTDVWSHRSGRWLCVSAHLTHCS